jgi:hypothetical protein
VDSEAGQSFGGQKGGQPGRNLRGAVIKVEQALLYLFKAYLVLPFHDLVLPFVLMIITKSSRLEIDINRSSDTLTTPQIGKGSTKGAAQRPHDG